MDKMAKRLRIVSLLTVVAILTLGPGPAAQANGPGTPASGKPDARTPACGDFQDCLELGVEAYVYGYPLVTMGITQRMATNVRDATSMSHFAPINQFSKATDLPDASFKGVVSPNVDTLYASAYLDLSQQPMILGLPEVDRYFLIQVMDAWSNNIEDAPGSRMGSPAGFYAFVGPNWRGTLPAGITEVYRMPTNMVWLLGRTYTTGSADDIAAVGDLMAKYTLTPLNKFGKHYTPPTHVAVDPNLDMSPAPQQVAKMDAATFFSTLAELMRSNPPSAADAPMVAKLAQIGIVPGQPFNLQRVDPTTREALEQAVKIAYDAIGKAANGLPVGPTHWAVPTQLGVYGTQYLVRAVVAYSGLGANFFLDAVYATTSEDAEGGALTGANGNCYQITFPADQLPPVNPEGFWSVTMYQLPGYWLVDNSINRYALGLPGSQDHVPCLNPDGSLTLYLQVAKPADLATTQYCNWLPAPDGDFNLKLRMYWPGDALFDAQNPWLPPAVQKTTCAD